MWWITSFWIEMRVVFTLLQDEILRQGVCRFKAKSWKKVGKWLLVACFLFYVVFVNCSCCFWIGFIFFAAEVLPGRTEVQCMHRWQKVLDPNLNKGHWTQQVPLCFWFFFFFFFGECKSLKVIFSCRRMRQSLSLLKNMGLRNGLLYHSLCQVELGSNVERGSY